MTNTRLVKVHPFFVQVADEYRENFRKRFGFEMPRTQASKQIAECFDKMLKSNGMPSFKTPEGFLGEKKKKNIIVDWEFRL